METVVETAAFVCRVKSLLDQTTREALVDYVARNPQAGAVMPGTGGIRKLRWAAAGRGKSGGGRVIYYYHNESMPLFLLTLFGKNEKADLSMAERNDLATLATLLRQQYVGKRGVR